MTPLEEPKPALPLATGCYPSFFKGTLHTYSKCLTCAFLLLLVVVVAAVVDAAAAVVVAAAAACGRVVVIELEIIRVSV